MKIIPIFQCAARVRRAPYRLLASITSALVGAALACLAAPAHATLESQAASNAPAGSGTKAALHGRRRHGRAPVSLAAKAAPHGRAAPARIGRVMVTMKVEPQRRHFVLGRAGFKAHLLASRAFGWPSAPDQVVLRSDVAYLVDQTTGNALFDKNSTRVVPIASITKLMMAMVVLDSHAALDEPITVSDEDRDYVKMTSSRLPVGATLSREDMLHIALMASENRAAAALSRYYPGGRPAFIAAMNAKAHALGMTDTYFESPNGLTEKNVSTARDLVKMVEAAYQYPLVRRFSTDLAYEVDPGRHLLAYHSTNMLVRDPKWDIGLQKTGFINEAGICLVMQTNIDGRPVVMVLLDSTGRYSDFADAGTLRSLVLADERAHVAALEPGHPPGAPAAH
jgi:D-alanyl-D-alanine endopeptidase (penicillin-binding protein 7)